MSVRRGKEKGRKNLEQHSDILTMGTVLSVCVCVCVGHKGLTNRHLRDMHNTAHTNTHIQAQTHNGNAVPV